MSLIRAKHGLEKEPEVARTQSDVCDTYEDDRISVEAIIMKLVEIELAVVTNHSQRN